MVKSYLTTNSIKNVFKFQLHEHFVKTPIIDEPKLEISTELEIEKLQTHVNNEISAYNEERKSLAEMGGSKKRKRDSFGGEDAQNSSKNLRIAETDFQTPVPNLNAGNNKFRKRKLDNNDFFVQKQARQDNNANDNRSQETNRGRGRNRNRSRQKTFNNKAMGAGQVQGQPFDYSAVDYKQFQGGASGIRNNNKKNKNKFKPQVLGSLIQRVMRINYFFFSEEHEEIQRDKLQQILYL